MPEQDNQHEHPGSVAGDNAGKISRPTPADDLNDLAGPEGTREAGKKQSVDPEDAG